MSWRRSLGNLWPDISFCPKVVMLCLWGALSNERSGLSPVSLLAVFSPWSKSNIIYIFMSHVWCIYSIYKVSAQAQYSRSCPIICSLRYNSSLDTWTVVRLTAAKLKPLMFSVLGFALPYIKLKSKLLWLTVSPLVRLGVRHPSCSL
jgi:hypothetical protein